MNKKMTATINLITLNALLFFGFGAGLHASWNSTMDHRANVVAQDETMRQAQAQENEVKGKAAFKAMTAGMHCVGLDKPFLTDHIVVTDGMPNLEWVTFDEALRIKERGSEWTVVAYCN